MKKPSPVLREQKPRVVMLCGTDASSHYVQNQLATVANVCRVVRERPSLWRTARQMYKRSWRLDFTYAFDRLMLAAYCRWKLLPQATQNVVWQRFQEGASFGSSEPTTAVRSINDHRVAELLRQLSPDLVVVSGTSIIQPHILKSAPSFVNLHLGITPLYRGAHGIIQAVIRKDWDHVGVTLHKVDTGIDTGGILRQANIEIDPEIDNILTLNAKATMLAAEVLCQWLLRTIPPYSNAITVSPPPGKSRLFYSPGLRVYRQFEKALANRLEECEMRNVA